MKILKSSSPCRQDGVAIVVVLVMLAILLIYILANVRSLDHLGRELRLVEQKQIQRLNSHTPYTNAVPETNAPATASQTPLH